MKEQFLSFWHVHTFTSNRSVTICNIAIEKIVSYIRTHITASIVQQNRSCYISICAVNSFSSSSSPYSLSSSSSLFPSNQSFLARRRVNEKEKEKRRRIYILHDTYVNM